MSELGLNLRPTFALSYDKNKHYPTHTSDKTSAITLVMALLHSIHIVEIIRVL